MNFLLRDCPPFGWRVQEEHQPTAIAIGRRDRLYFVTHLFSSESVRCALALEPSALAWAREPRWFVLREGNLSLKPSLRSTNTPVTAPNTCLAGTRRSCSITLLVLTHVEIAVSRSLHISRRVVALLRKQCKRRITSFISRLSESLIALLSEAQTTFAYCNNNCLIDYCYYIFLGINGIKRVPVLTVEVYSFLVGREINSGRRITSLYLIPHQVFVVLPQ